MASNPISPKVADQLDQVIEEIRQRVQAYADLKGISFEEARKRAKLTIDGKAYQIDEESDEQD